MKYQKRNFVITHLFFISDTVYNGAYHPSPIVELNYNFVFYFTVLFKGL